MTPKQLSKKTIQVWYRSYFGSVTPMLRMFKNKNIKNLAQDGDYIDYNIEKSDVEKLIIAGIRTGEFTITEFKSAKRYPAIKFN